MRYSISFIALLGLLVANVSAIEELPLGSTKDQLIKAYGPPQQPPINNVVVSGEPESKENEKVETAIYWSLKPGRFYWLKDNQTTGVHYDSLKGFTLDAVKVLLSAHAKGEKIIEVPTKDAGWSYEGAFAWRCSTQGWIALYRPEHDDTFGSLLIWIEPKDEKPNHSLEVNPR
jgi:hypothetical protein